MNTSTPTGASLPPPPTAPPPSPTRRLVRIPDQGRVAGVAAGIGWYLGVDPTVVRIALVVLTVGNGVGIPIYLGSWLIMPKAASSSLNQTAPPQRDARSLTVIALAIVGVLTLFGAIDLFSPSVLWAAVLIGAGVLLFNDRAPRPKPHPPWRGDDNCGPPWTQGWGSPSRERTARPPQSAYEQYTGAWQTPQPRPPRRPRSILGRLGLALWLLMMGLVFMLGLTPVRIVAVSILTAGAVLLVGTLFGRARWLIPVGVLAILGLAAHGVAVQNDISLFDGVGDNTITVNQVEDLQPSYGLTGGKLTLDLSALDLAGQSVQVEAGVSAGELDVIVPSDVSVHVLGRLSAGDYDLLSGSDPLGEIGEGAGVEFDSRFPVEDANGELALTINSGLGHISLSRAERQ